MSAPAPIELTPTAMAAGGDAIARDADGRVVFVTGALPDERVRAVVDVEHRDYAHAHAIEVVHASPLRVAPACPELARGCGGCQWQHVSVEGQRQIKRDIVADALRRIAKLPDAPVAEPVALPADGYRTTVRAAVVDGRAGYRRARSHQSGAVESCLVAHPLIEELLVRGRYGRAREVVLRCGARTGERMAAPVPSDATIDVPDDVRRDHVHELAGGRRWRISAASFFQSRPDGADALVALVQGAASGRIGTAVDLYSGVGLFAGTLADGGWRVTAVEGSRAAVADARDNLTDVEVVHTDVLHWQPTPADLVVADPSRAGLGARGVQVIEGTGATTVVLVSCDPAALGRDAGLLTAAGYRLATVTPVDLFPHTFHIEAVSVFER